MNLSELISEFKEVTGKYNISDSKITRWLNKGGDRLASMLQAADAKMYVLATLEEGKNFIELSQFLKSVDQIWVLKDHKYVELRIWSNFDDFVDLYYKAGDSGTPVGCVRVPRIRIDSSSLISLALETGDLMLSESGDILTGPDFLKDSMEQWTIDHGTSKNHLMLMFNCPADTDYSIRVIGHGSAQDLVENADENWLSLQNPDLLVVAAQMLMEREHKNWEGYGSLRQVIQDEVTDMVRGATIEYAANWTDAAMEID